MRKSPWRSSRRVIKKCGYCQTTMESSYLAIAYFIFCLKFTDGASRANGDACDRGRASDGTDGLKSRGRVFSCHWP